MSQIDTVRAQGFDLSYPRRVQGRPAVHVACSQCAALVINGVATHEHGCPNQVYTCKGCHNTVARRGQYCAECR